MKTFGRIISVVGWTIVAIIVAFCILAAPLAGIFEYLKIKP